MTIDRDDLMRHVEAPPAGTLSADWADKRRRILEEEVRANSHRDRWPALAGLGGQFRWTRALALAGAALGIAGLVMTWSVVRSGDSDLAQAATPAMLAGALTTAGDASSALGALARSIDRSTATEVGAYSVTVEQWSLSSRIDDGDVVHSAIVPELRELTWADDLSGLLRVTTGAPQFPSDQYREQWASEGSPGFEGTVLEEHTFAPGEFAPMYPSALPSGSTELLEALSVGHPIDQYGTAELFQAVIDLNLERQPTVSETAAILDLLSARTDVTLLEAPQDRASRDAIAIATDSGYSGLPTRYILMFDLVSGNLLAAEQVLLSESGKLDVPTPSVIEYTLFMR